MKNKLELRTITADTIQRIVKFMVETETEDIIGRLLFDTDLPEITWAELRQKADLGTGDLKKLQEEYDDPRYAALHVEKQLGIEIISQDITTIKDVYKEVMYLMADNKKWEKTKELVAHLYQTDKKSIGDMPINDIMDLFRNLIKDSGFTGALS